MTPAVAEVDELWAAVGDPTRRRVLDVLLDRGEATAFGKSSGSAMFSKTTSTPRLAVNFITSSVRSCLR